MLAVAYKILFCNFLLLLYCHTSCALLPKVRTVIHMRLRDREDCIQKTSLDSHLMSSSPQPLRILPKEDIDRWDVRSRLHFSFTQNRNVQV